MCHGLGSFPFFAIEQFGWCHILLGVGVVDSSDEGPVWLTLLLCYTSWKEVFVTAILGCVSMGATIGLLHHCSTSLAIFAWCLFYSRVLSMHYKYFCAVFPKIEFCPCIILFSYSVRSICTVWFDTPLLTVTNCISPWIKFGLCIILCGCTLFLFLLSGILSVYFILFSLEEFCLGLSLLFQLSYTKFSLCTS
jgi:hypothetical protein